MTDEQKTKLKWTYLLEKIRFGIQVIRFKFYYEYSFVCFKIKTNSNYAKPIVRIACLFPRQYLPLNVDDKQ